VTETTCGVGTRVYLIPQNTPTSLDLRNILSRSTITLNIKINVDAAIMKRIYFVFQGRPPVIRLQTFGLVRVSYFGGRVLRDSSAGRVEDYRMGG